MKRLVFATGNPNKIREVREVLGESYEFLGLDDIGCTKDLPETGDTLQANALQKARYVYENFGCDCFAEDSGLEVVALHGEPGVYTAMYAGEERDAKKNMDLVLAKLGESTNRNAQFRTVFALIIDGNEYLFEGMVEGNIGYAAVGNHGFGYDPIFYPAGSELTFGQMNKEQKNRISHRTRAFQKMYDFLQISS